LDDDGVTFRSHIDGSEQRFTPELVIETQENLGADIIMCLDECAVPLDRDYLGQALRRTHLWAERCRAAQRRDDQALFGVRRSGGTIRPSSVSCKAASSPTCGRRAPASSALSTSPATPSAA
jgi:tRNA-guanine family transglycosylase